MVLSPLAAVMMALPAPASHASAHPAATCSPAMDSAFVHRLPSTKAAGTLLQPLSAEPPASTDAATKTDRGCRHTIG